MASIDLQPTENKSPSHQTTIIGAEAVVQALIQEGVDIAFGYPGWSNYAGIRRAL